MPHIVVTPPTGPPKSSAVAQPVVVQVKQATGGMLIVSGGKQHGGGIEIYVVSHKPLLHVTTQAVSATLSNGPVGVKITQPFASGVLIV